MTGYVSGMDWRPKAPYTHLVRSTDDPDRSPREARKGQEAAWRLKLGKKTQPQWRDRIVELLADGEARTFNRICVELGDVTADMGYLMAPDEALWALVVEGAVKHTLETPVLFKAVDR